MSLVDILILGAGWSSSFLIPLCREHGLSYAATSRQGVPGTLKFSFDPDPTSHDQAPFEVLPTAAFVLVTFPIKTPGASEKLVTLYKQSRPCEHTPVSFIQLGTAAIWGPAQRTENKIHWYDRHSPITLNDRAIAEQELLALAPTVPVTVLNLAGLWGGNRSPRNWVERVSPTKDHLKFRGSIHLIHGFDLARAILAVVAQFPKATGQRWILTDRRVYDWWDLASAWGDGGEQSRGKPSVGPQACWVHELMEEQGLRSLPRDSCQLGRALDSNDFWSTFGLFPVRARVE